MTLEPEPKIGRLPEELVYAIKAAEYSLEQRREDLGNGDPVKDGGVNFRGGLVDALRWVLGEPDTTLEAYIKSYGIVHGPDD